MFYADINSTLRNYSAYTRIAYKISNFPRSASIRSRAAKMVSSEITSKLDGLHVFKPYFT